MHVKGVALRSLIDDFGFDIAYDGGHVATTTIDVPDLTRPGLQLVGYFKHFEPDRIQLIGNMEMAFLDSLSSEEKLRSLDRLFMTGIPCLIMAGANDPPKEMIMCAERYGVPILKTDAPTSSVFSALVKHLNVELAPRCTIHGVLVEVLGEGVLMLGESGVGKSETALELVKRGHRLIADDMVEVRRVSQTTLLGRSPENIRHLIEIRGLGILDVKELYGVSSVKIQERVDFVINLEFWDESKNYRRLGNEEEQTDILGVCVPSVTIPVRPGRNLAIIVEFAAINFRNQMMGYDTVREVTERIYLK
jgi:HPr kinase/phosphorylase